MILPRRVVHCLLLALAAANVIFRYPVDTSHELGADTTFVHTLTTSLVDEGRALWILHPTSYFGLYALSYPSGIPFVFASGTLLAGIPVEGVMLLFGWIVSVAGAYGAFATARQIRRDDMFALLVATLFSFTPFYIKDTFWIGSSRGFVVALLPVFVAMLLRHLKTLRFTYLGLSTVLLAALASIHRMGFLAVFILFAFIFAIPFHRLSQRLRFALIRYERPSRFGFFGAAILGFLGMFYVQFLYPGIAGADVVEQYGEGTFFRGASFPTLVANMGVSLAGKIGPLVPFALVGLIAYSWRRPKEVVDKFVLSAFFIFLPMLSLRDYIAEFLFLFFVVLVAVGLLSIRRLAPNRRQIAVLMISALLAVSVATSWIMKDYWGNKYGTDAPIPDETYSTATYLHHSSDGTIIANQGLMGGRIAAISGRPVVPLGGPSLHWTSPQQLTWGFQDPGRVSVRLLDVTSISFNTDEIFVAEDIRNAEVDWESILFYTSPLAADRNLRLYDIHYAVVDDRIPNSFTSYGYDRPSLLLPILRENNYKVYDSPGQSVWYIG